MYKCMYCDKTVGNKGCLVLHEKYCLHNPNRIKTKTNIYKENQNKKRDEHGKIPSVLKGKKLSDEHKQKIRESLNNWRKTHQEEFLNYSRGKSKCAENFKKYLRENNIDFIEEYCPYPEERLYSLDIAFPDEKIAIEINGSQHYNNGDLNDYTLNKQYFFEERGWKIIQIYYKWCYGVISNNKCISSIFDLPIHNKNYVKECFTREYRNKMKREEKIKQKEYKNKLRKQIIYNLITNSNIDFSNRGWSSKAKKYLEERNELWNKGIFRCIRKYYPDFLKQDNVWKRKGSMY